MKLFKILLKDLAVILIAASVGIAVGLHYESVTPAPLPAAQQPAEPAGAPASQPAAASASAQSKTLPASAPPACQAQQDALQETEAKIWELQKQIDLMVDAADNLQQRCNEDCKRYEKTVAVLKQLKAQQHASLAACRKLQLDDSKSHASASEHPSAS